MSEQLQQALKLLDPANANHWTADGLPRLETVKFLGKLESVTRDEINAVAPGLTIATAPALGVPAAPPVAPPPPPASKAKADAAPVVKAEDEIGSLKNEIARLEERLAAAHERQAEDGHSPEENISSVIGQYHARQKEVLELRAKLLEEVRTSGMNLKLLSEKLKAPIDAAKARKK